MNLFMNDSMKVAFVIFVLILPGEIFSRDYMALSKKLASLRTEVENLNRNLEEIRKKYNEELRSYSIQKAELQATIRSEEIKKEQLRLKVKTLKTELSENEQGNLNLKPLVLSYIEKLDASIEKSLPFKKEERRLNLTKIKTDMEKGDISSYQALSRLWSAFEDEARLTRENQLSKEQISMNGKTYLAEVVKLGSVGLFFRLEDGTQGKGVFQDNEWQFLPLKERAEILASKKLFEGIRKQIKTGEYLVPTRSRL